MISRTSVMQYKGSPRSLREIGQALDAATILEGAVQRAGDTVRISMQLIDSASDAHLWGATYDRELTTENIFAIQSEVAAAVAQALQAELTPEEVARIAEIPTASTRAYNLYLSGREYEKRADTFQALPLALRQYEHALEIDPDFALAWARLSTVHIMMYWFALDRTEERRQQALEAVDNAFRIRPDLPEAHLAMAWFYYHGHLDYENAFRELDRAELGLPSDVDLLYARAAIYRRQNRWELAIDAYERANEIDPRNAQQITQQGLSFVFLRNYEKAERYFDEALEIAPDATDPRVWKARLPAFRSGDVSRIKELASPPPGDQWRGIDLLMAWTAALYERNLSAALVLAESWTDETVVNIRTIYLPKPSMLGVTLMLMHEDELAHQQFAIARAQVEKMLDENASDPRLLIALGETLAGFGDYGAATALAERAIRLMPSTLDAVDGPQIRLDATIRVLAAAGASDRVVQELDDYLSAPGSWSIEGLLPDPRLDPLHRSAALERLVNAHARW